MRDLLQSQSQIAWEDMTRRPFRIGAFDDPLSGQSLEDMLEWYVEQELDAVELGVGGWTRGRHIDVSALLRERRARERLHDAVTEHGLAISAINAAGNPLHPDARVAQSHHALLRAAVELAQAMGVRHVVAMSGCPGGPGSGTVPVFGPWALNCDMEDLLRWQWSEVVEPFWREFGAWLRRSCPDVRICLELHPGVFAYNAPTYWKVRQAGGHQLAVNLDPAHLWWQGMDPVAVIEELGGEIGFFHAKDCLIHPDRVRRHGVLDAQYPPDPVRSSWTFAAVGRGHSVETWGEILSALRGVGYEGDISIEQEDPAMSAEQGISASAASLREAVRVVDES